MQGGRYSTSGHLPVPIPIGTVILCGETFTGHPSRGLAFARRGLAM